MLLVRQCQRRADELIIERLDQVKVIRHLPIQQPRTQFLEPLGESQVIRHQHRTVEPRDPESESRCRFEVVLRVMDRDRRRAVDGGLYPLESRRLLLLEGLDQRSVIVRGRYGQTFRGPGVVESAFGVETKDGIPRIIDGGREPDVRDKRWPWIVQARGPIQYRTHHPQICR